MLAAVKPWLSNKALLTVFIITSIVLSLLLITSNQAEAVQVSVTTSANSISPGSSIIFTTTVSIESTERIPIRTAKLSICSDAGCNSQLTSSPYRSPRTMLISDANPSTGYKSYGPGYGFDSNLGIGYTFPEGEGHGGYSGVVTLTYQYTMTTSTAWAAGTYFARADIDCSTHTFSSTPVSFTITASGDGNGDGGAGGASGGTAEQPAETPVVTPTPTPPTEPRVQERDLTNEVNDDGVVLEDVSITFSNGIVSLKIPANTTALNAQGQPLTEITMVAPPAPALLPTGQHLVMVTDLGPSGATFEPPILVTITYDPDSLPAGAVEEDLTLAIHDAENKGWVSLNQISVDLVNHTVSGLTGHFTQFAILAEIAPPSAPESPDAPAPTDAPVSTVTPLPTEDMTPTDAPVPTDTNETIDAEDDDDDGLNPWVIIGPVIGVLAVGVMLNLRRMRAKR